MTPQPSRHPVRSITWPWPCSSGWQKMGKGVRNRKQEAKGGYVKAADMEPVLRFRPWRGTWLQITLALENLDEGKAWYVPFACSSVLGAAGQGVWAMDPPPAAAAAEAAVAAGRWEHHGDSIRLCPSAPLTSAFSDGVPATWTYSSPPALELPRGGDPPWGSIPPSRQRWGHPNLGRVGKPAGPRGVAENS